MERTRQESGKYYDYNSLANYTHSIYNNMVLNRIQDIVHEKDQQIIALHTEIQDLKSGNEKKENDSLNKGSDHCYFGIIMPQRKDNIRPKIFKEEYQ